MANNKQYNRRYIVRTKESCEPYDFEFESEGGICKQYSEWWGFYTRKHVSHKHRVHLAGFRVRVSKQS